MPQKLSDHREFLEREVLTNPAIATHQFEQPDNFTLHYRSRGTATQAVAVWIHGTPGSWADIGHLFVNDEFLAKVRLVSLDRPGWGKSHHRTTPHPPPGSLPDFADQAKHIAPLLEKLAAAHPNVPLILAGHSWGGSLAPYLAAEQSTTVDGILILAGGLDPALAAPRWYNRLANLWPVRQLLPPALIGANREIYALRPNLQKMANRWQTLQMPILVIQGTKDSLVHPANAPYARTRLKNNPNTQILELPNQGHLLQIEQTPLIAQCILALAQKNLPKCTPTPIDNPTNIP